MIALTPEQMQAMDKQVIRDGFPGIILMETAGRGVAERAAAMVDPSSRIMVFAGKGNNGGDGLVAARYLEMWGYQVQIFGPDKEDVSGSPEKNYQICLNRNMQLHKLSDNPESELKRADLVIDALLGTGITGEVRGRIARLIEIINQSEAPVLAVDIPSGISGLTGEVLGCAVQADRTATMAFPKIGCCIYPGKDHTGELEVIDLGMPAEPLEKINYNHFLLTWKQAGELLPAREVTGHKGSFGRVGVIGGSPGMEGAPSLCGYSALKAGAGLVQLAVPESIRSTVAGRFPELITTDLSGETEDQKLDYLLDRNDVLAVGPGLGQGSGARQLLAEILKKSEIPLIIDADGLNVIAGMLPDMDLTGTSAPLIFTPHPGEFSRLTDQSISQIQKHRIDSARDFAVNNQLYLVLKGAVTVIALPDGRVYLNQSGNPGLATAGSGDVLTGMIAGLLAQDTGVAASAILGPYLHGYAGDLAARELTGYSVTAGDLFEFLPRVFRELQK
ncbi:MAG: NAD(P)H-hydrate dehydratase [Bacillota bacterium]